MNKRRKGYVGQTVNEELCEIVYTNHGKPMAEGMNIVLSISCNEHYNIGAFKQKRNYDGTLEYIV